MSQQIRISAKHLGQLALADFCPRCFWIRLRCADKLPFQIFPGVFASIDSYTKKTTAMHHQKYGLHRLDPVSSCGVPVACSIQRQRRSDPFLAYCLPRFPPLLEIFRSQLPSIFSTVSGGIGRLPRSNTICFMSQRSKFKEVLSKLNL